MIVMAGLIISFMSFDFIATFVISFILAFILGVLSGNSEKIQHFLEPLMITLKAIPTAVIVFLFLVIVAPKNSPICVVVLISLPILYEAIVGGLKSTPKAINKANQTSKEECDCENRLRCRLPPNNYWAHLQFVHKSYSYLQPQTNRCGPQGNLLCVDS